MIPLLMAMAVGPFLSWKRGDLWAALERLKIAFSIAAFVSVLTLSVMGVKSVGAACGLALAAWLFAATIVEWAERIRLFSEPLSGSFRRALRLPRAAWGMTFAHAGMAVVVAGITGSSAWTVEKIVGVKPPGSVELAGYTVALDAVTDAKGPDYTATRADIRLLKGDQLVTEMHPEKRFFPRENGNQTDVSIRTKLLADVYVVVGDPDGKGGYTLRLYWNPLVPWIWLGAGLMAFGGLVSLSDRRHRVGAPSRRARRLAGAAQPAE
jgi:cytochrome c-type biogenesis protein CcmF